MILYDEDNDISEVILTRQNTLSYVINCGGHIISLACYIVHHATRSGHRISREICC